jgi:uncharacterized protein YbjT (DUF2867 family)
VTADVLVTGATGFTGRRVVAALVAAGHRVTAFVRPSSDPAVASALGVPTATGDLGAPETLRAALAGKTALVHVASLGFGHAPGIVAAAKDAGIARSVFFSTAAVHTRLPSATKPVRLEAERLVLEGGIGAVVLRPTMIYGAPGDRNLERLVRFVARRKIVPIPGDGKGLQQPVHVEDVAAAAAKALGKPELAGRAFDLPGPEPMTFEAMVRMVARVLGKSRWFPHVPAFLFRVVASQEQVARLAEDKSCDPRPAGDAFGHAPRPFEQGITEEAEALGLLRAARA